jgi:FkbM family methyltransferase
MSGLISRGLNVLKEEGIVSFVKKTTQYFQSKRTPYIQTVDQIAKRNHLLGAIITPIYCLLNGYFVIKKRSYYIKYTFRKNVFDRRRLYVVDLETIQKGDRMEERYFLHDKCSLDPSDTVFDIGAARGISTQVAAQKAARVFAFEPSPRMFNCLKKNINEDSIQIYQQAAWDEPGEMNMNYGIFSKDDSLLEPDTGQTGISKIVRVDTVEKFAKENGVEKIDFAKIEAEGGEPEVIDGIGSLPVEKIVVNCSPEREGKSPSEEVIKKLTAMGYEIDSPEDTYEVFAWRPQ